MFPSNGYNSQNLGMQSPMMMSNPYNQGIQGNYQGYNHQGLNNIIPNENGMPR